jgi:hypothetical protein
MPAVIAASGRNAELGLGDPRKKNKTPSQKITKKHLP